ncbi:MAG: DUF1549 and DUF1553 domain-containing protein [Planctomycetes bacterium]|nr:DUF1549 and DUF1553 domain-containing protein [Planctomycetota bacterium]
MMRTRPTLSAILFVLFLHVASQGSAQTTTQTASSSFWAFQPVVDTPPPAVNDREWPQTDLDRFVLAKLEERELRPSPRADKRTLLRRVTFDLVGVPPTPEEVASFLDDDSPDAFAKVIDRLLASARYGERWGRHWLDVARYADSNGLDENAAYANAWRYRNYVILALGADRPYDEFVTEQLAGDLLPRTDDDRVTNERLIATGFLALGPKFLAEKDPQKMEMDIIDEQIDTVGRTFMGLTLGCARCHDHKFDPILTEDYYGLAGIFKSTRTMEHFIKFARWYENPLQTEANRAAKEKYDRKLAEFEAKIAAIIAKANAELTKGGKPLPQIPEVSYSKETRAELRKVQDARNKLRDSSSLTTALGATERDVVDVQVHKGGSHLRLGKKVPRRFPLVLSGDGQTPFEKAESGRMRLAQWLTSGSHPLTARVMANRLWRWHFGRGLVRSTDNFGKLGERPSNQALLDWLACRFVESGWSLKAMHRLILLSATYQMSDLYDPRAADVDPDNRLHWRANVRRLEAEAIRDSLLAVSGLLDTTMGESLLKIENRKHVFHINTNDETSYDSYLRSVYLPVVRNHLYDVFSLFDYTDASVINGDRPTTTIAPQALFLMNSKLMGEVARELATRILRGFSVSSAVVSIEDDHVRDLYLTAYGREPTLEEVDDAARLLRSFDDELMNTTSDAQERRQQAWQLFCQIIVAANEFVYVR